MPRETTDISPRGAIMLGLVLVACGVAPILGALEIIPYPLTRGTPVWVGVAAGGVFILGGAALINGRAVFGFGAIVCAAVAIGLLFGSFRRKL